MEDHHAIVNHMLLVKFKDEVTEQQIEESIKRFANLVSLIPSMKSFRWGKDVSVENLHQGFTHVFEVKFESTQGVEEYLYHPDHVAFADAFRPQIEKIIVVDYKPTIVQI